MAKIDAAMMELERGGEVGRTLEAQGFDGVITFEGNHDPFIPLVLAAAQTERLDLMTSIAIAFARNPMLCAYVANDVQLVSRGRFVLGLGTQIRPHIEKRFSQVWSKPNARMREFVHALRTIWRAWETGERLAHRGEFYTHTLMTPFFSPGPNPYGWPKIALAGFGPAMIRVAGEVADRWIVHPLNSLDYVRVHGLPALAAGATRANRSPESIEISCQTIAMIGSNDAEIG